MPAVSEAEFVLRPATMDDLPALWALIPESARDLSRGFYGDELTEAAIRHVFGPDTTLIRDGTYFVVGHGAEIVACGGWGKRDTLHGGDQTKSGEERLLDPRSDPARIRAFFVHPRWARHGLASRVLEACVDAARAAGFRSLELAATLPGVPFYQRRGFASHGEFAIALPGGLSLPVVRMSKSLR